MNDAPRDENAAHLPVEVADLQDMHLKRQRLIKEIQGLEITRAQAAAALGAKYPTHKEERSMQAVEQMSDSNTTRSLTGDDQAALKAIVAARTAVFAAVDALSAAMGPTATVEAKHREGGPHPFPVLLQARDNLLHVTKMLHALEQSGLMQGLEHLGPQPFTGIGWAHRGSREQVLTTGIY